MKYISAVIQPEKLDDVLEKLEKNEINLVTVAPVLGRGRQKAAASGEKKSSALIKKMKIEIAVNDEYVKPSVLAIIDAGRTGEIGDGKIFIMNLEECIRIRSGEKGRVAIG